jgi:tRNA pseudouridine55 synthase
VIDGVLVVDKPSGITSHDVVASARRALGEPRIGHTGTLDPLATGVLPLACGRATRLVQFLTASDKEYDARIRVGLATDTYDVTGREVSRSDLRPSGDEVAAALRTFEGALLQAPPPFSAKRVGGRRAYDLAREDQAVQPPAAPVSLRRVELRAWADGVAVVGVVCSAGFYVRSLAHDLGVALGTGACLEALRRTRSGDFDLSQGVTLDVLVNDPPAARERALPLERLLPAFPAVSLTDEGRTWVSHGRELGARQALGPLPDGAAWVRLFGPEGTLVALGTPGTAPGSLHPSVVLI